MRHASPILLRLLAIAACLLLQACAKPPAPPEKLEPWMGTVEDLAFFPQDLNVYAKAAGSEKRLIPAAESAAQDARFDRILFGPWELSRSTIRRKEVAALFLKARGFKESGERWTQPEWNAMAANAALRRFPSRRQPAITLRATDLRDLPTHQPRLARPTPNTQAYPFDMFQLSLLPPGTPLLIAHTSRDGMWHYVECPIAGGWVDANDVAMVNPTFARAYRNGRYAAIIRDGVSLAPPDAPPVTVSIGAVLPIADTEGENTQLLLPGRNPQGWATISTVTAATGDAVTKPLPLTPGNVARIGNHMMGQPYGWGGMFGNRDCSALTRDLLAPFGIWLPRNSSIQARQGEVTSLEDMTTPQKEETILAKGIPFLSLVGLRGHITLYVGSHKNRAALFHNMWGLRVVNGDDTNDRLVIGRTVVTGISPGKELPNLYLDATLADRLRTLSNPADPGQ